MILKPIRTTFFSIAMAGMLMASCQQTAQEQTAEQSDAIAATEPPVFQQEAMNSAYARYQQLQEALVKADSEKAKETADALQEALAAAQEGAEVSKDAQVVAEAADLEGQRAAFVALSESMTSLVKNSGLASGTLYVAFCPMANHDQGAYWLSSEQTIRNPYYGNKMLTCGSIQETID